MPSLPTRSLGKNGPAVSALGLGAMGMGGFYGQSDEKESLNTLTSVHSGDKVLGKWFAQTGPRSEIILATKFGSIDMSDGGDPTKPNSKPVYIRSRLRNSLADLQIDYIDLYYQHRVDPEVPIKVVLETLRPFVENGTIKWIGLSDPSISTLRRAKAVKDIGEKVVAAQMEFSPFEMDVEESGFADVINEYGMAVVAYSPLARGLATGRFCSRKDFGEGDLRSNLPRFSEENFPKNLKVVEELRKFADKYNATTSQITLAWILAEHPNFIPIPGIRNSARLEKNARGAELKLSAEDVKAIRTVVESAEVSGERYPEARMPKGDCIPLSEWKGQIL